MGDIEGNARLISAWIARARQAGAQLVVFPEQTVTGYPAEDLWLKPHFLDAARRASTSSPPRPGRSSPWSASRSAMRPPTTPSPCSRTAQVQRRLPQGPASELRRLRRAPLLRARRHPGADRGRRGPRRADDLRGHLVPGSAGIGGGAGRRQADRQSLGLALPPWPGRLSGADGRRSGPGRPARRSPSATWSAARTSWCSTDTAWSSPRRAETLARGASSPRSSSSATWSSRRVRPPSAGARARAGRAQPAGATAPAARAGSRHPRRAAIVRAAARRAAGAGCGGL